MSDRIILGQDGRKYITNEPLLHEDKQATELRRLHTLNSELMEALRKIASTDYRGNQPQEIAIARAALAKVEASK